MAPDEACEDRGNKGGHVWIDEEGFVGDHGGCEKHHLMKDECIIERMGDFLCNELYQVWD